MKRTLLHLISTTRAKLTLAVAVALAVAAAVLVSVSPASGTGTGNPKPTIVLVHGGWADSSGWNSEIERLQKDGYPVIAPANPLRGLGSDAAYIRSVLHTISGPIVLVGHSYGGAVITNAAVGAPNVKALVYIAGFAPDAGESLAQLVTKNPGTQITPDALLERPYPQPDGTTGTDLYIKASVFREAFAGDLSVSTTRLMQATQRPFSVAAFTEASGTPGWKTIPSWYLVATEDHAIPPVTQRFMAERAKAHVVEVESSHVPMMSRPKTTTDLILRAARATR
jgi:pimeloyl-ACP methyl ester carboxylesterase